MELNTCSNEQLFNAIGIETKKDKDGKLIISKYKQPSNNFTFEDIGFNEDKLFKDIVEIEGTADFRYSQLTSLGNLKHAGNDAIVDDNNSSILIPMLEKLHINTEFGNF